MAVKVVLNKSTDTLEFHPESGADNDVADYLCRLVKEARTVGMERSVLVSKARLGDTVLQVRKAQEEKIQVLKSVADKYETQARDWSLTWEVRDIANRKAFAAKEEARRITAELEGR